MYILMLPLTIIYYFRIHLEISEKIENILTSVVKCCLQLKLTEVKSIVQYCFPTVTDKSIIRQIVQFLRNPGDIVVNDTTKREPVILILHDVSIF